jgi:RecA-family ATPase
VEKEVGVAAHVPSSVVRALSSLAWRVAAEERAGKAAAMGVLRGRVEREEEALFLSTMAKSAATSNQEALFLSTMAESARQQQDEEERRRRREKEEGDQDHQDEVATLMKALQRTRELGRKQSHLLRRQRHQCSVLTGREIMLTASNRSDSVAAKEAVQLGNLRRLVVSRSCKRL